ncbi:MAG: hypothetical protein ACJAQ0_001660 [Dasania sp.]|jgi:hypothetical protein
MYSIIIVYKGNYMPNTANDFKSKQKNVARKTQQKKYDKPLMRNKPNAHMVKRQALAKAIINIKNLQYNMSDTNITKLVGDIGTLLPYGGPEAFKAIEALIDHRSEQLNCIKVMPKFSASNPHPQPQSCLETLYIRVLNSSSS